MEVEDHHKHSDAVYRLRLAVADLSDLAEAAYMLGNERLGKKLSAIAFNIKDALEMAEAGYSQAISDRLIDAQTHSAAMLATICHLGSAMKEPSA